MFTINRHTHTYTRTRHHVQSFLVDVKEMLYRNFCIVENNLQIHFKYLFSSLEQMKMTYGINLSCTHISFPPWAILPVFQFQVPNYEK